jgi:hypothetical protein
MIELDLQFGSFFLWRSGRSWHSLSNFNGCIHRKFNYNLFDFCQFCRPFLFGHSLFGVARVNVLTRHFAHIQMHIALSSPTSATTTIVRPSWPSQASCSDSSGWLGRPWTRRLSRPHRPCCRHFRLFQDSSHRHARSGLTRSSPRFVSSSP